MRARPAAAVVVFVALVACGGGGGNDTATGTTAAPTPNGADARTELEQTVRNYSAAYVEGDADSAVALLSARCRQLVGAQVPAAVALAKRSFADARIVSLAIDEQSADRARVTYRYNRPELDQVLEPWVRETAGWRQDNC